MVQVTRSIAVQRTMVGDDSSSAVIPTLGKWTQN